MSCAVTTKKRNITFQKVLTTSGTPERLLPYISATTIAFTTSTITDSGSKFTDKGFQPGMRIKITSSDTTSKNHNVITQIGDSATDALPGTLTLKSGFTLTTESAGSTITIVPEPNFMNVPDGVKCLVKAKFANTGTITIADSEGKALNTKTFHMKLRNNEDYKEFVDPSVLWFDATVSGEGIEVSYGA